MASPCGVAAPVLCLDFDAPVPLASPKLDPPDRRLPVLVRHAARAGSRASPRSTGGSGGTPPHGPSTAARGPSPPPPASPSDAADSLTLNIRDPFGTKQAHSPAGWGQEQSSPAAGTQERSRALGAHDAGLALNGTQLALPGTHTSRAARPAHAENSPQLPALAPFRVSAGQDTRRHSPGALTPRPACPPGGGVETCASPQDGASGGVDGSLHPGPVSVAHPAASSYAHGAPAAASSYIHVDVSSSTCGAHAAAASYTRGGQRPGLVLPPVRLAPMPDMWRGPGEECSQAGGAPKGEGTERQFGAGGSEWEARARPSPRAPLARRGCIRRSLSARGEMGNRNLSALSARRGGGDRNLSTGECMEDFNLSARWEVGDRSPFGMGAVALGTLRATPPLARLPPAHRRKLLVSAKPYPHVPHSTVGGLGRPLRLAPDFVVEMACAYDRRPLPAFTGDLGFSAQRMC